MNGRKLFQDLDRSKNAAHLGILSGWGILILGIYVGLYHHVPWVLPVCAGLAVLSGYGVSQTLCIFRENHQILHGRQDVDMQRIHDQNFMTGEWEPDALPENIFDG